MSDKQVLIQLELHEIADIRYMFLRKCTYELGLFHANLTTKCLRNQSRTKGEGWSTAN